MTEHNQCKKCGGSMMRGIAIEETFSGEPDFPGHEAVTLSASGPGKLVSCLKCEKCGWSVHD